ncbi:MAG: glycosyltransferase [Planctomycetaceae bacterium]|nr:glycosyltransferase [Planctomycetaceae bacterium]
MICPVSWTDQLRTRGRRLPPGTESLGPNLTADYPTYYFTPRILRAYYGEFMEWSIGKRVEQAIREMRPDAIVSYWAHPDGAVAVNHARRVGIPAIAMVGGSDVLLLVKSGTRRKKILETLKNADRVVAVSEDIAERLERDGISHSKLRVIRRGVQKEIFYPGDQLEARRRLGLPESRKIVIAVGRLVGVKGFDRLIGAFKKMHEQGEDILGFILGEGELRKSLQQQIELHGLTERVFLPGSQPQEKLADWYRAADVTVLSSWSEGVPNVLLESISCGRSFVATNVGGVSEIADPHLDRLVNTGDVAGLAAGILEQLHRAPETVKRQFQPTSWEESAELLRNEIRACLGIGEEVNDTPRELVGVSL